MSPSARVTTVVAAVAVMAALVPGCLTRPGVSVEPTTKVTFTTKWPKGVDKIDLLFVIDNSQSMGDKQDYLRQAIPDLVTRLVTPNCVDPNDGAKVLGVSRGDGTCDRGEVEFPPVHDMHIGLLSTALGPRLGDFCSDGAQGNDEARLLTRATPAMSTSTAVADSGFLGWFPSGAANDGVSSGAGAKAIRDAVELETAFQDLVSGVGQSGCGIESPLESWYRFLIQPDPYDDLMVENGRATWKGYDAQILKQRHDFLRPDSLVAIIVLSDEDDSEIDVRAMNGQAYQFMKRDYQPPRATSICRTNPADPACRSCDAALNPTNGPNDGATDPACAVGPYRDGDGYDGNLRHVHMKEKYGVDPQYPITRYLKGLTSRGVPDRTHEYPPGATSYVGDGACRNPLFAASLPDGSSTDEAVLCNMNGGIGPRTAELVFYAHIGGVPHQLLHFTPGDPKASALTDDDWVKILGRDPLHYDYSGIDPHMIASFAPRPGLPPPGSAAGADPISGHEWITNEGSHQANVDLQYACTFRLPKARDCRDAANREACDCPATSGALSAEQLPPVCDPSSQVTQIAAKAYPTTRELLLAKLAGKQGIVSSICPEHVEEQGAGDPLFGYRPAVASIVDRLKEQLTQQCLPRRLAPDARGVVPCLVLVTLPEGIRACDSALGLSSPDPAVLVRFRQQQEDEWLKGGGAQSGAPDPKNLTVCQAQQLLDAELVDGSCATSKKPGWCYVTGGAAGKCPQGILFAPGLPPSNAVVNLQCIEAAETNGE